MASATEEIIVYLKYQNMLQRGRPLIESIGGDVIRQKICHDWLALRAPVNIGGRRRV